MSRSGKATNGSVKKLAPRVDLTAMVDLMFLLTTFFMLTTSLGSLNAADIAKPADSETERHDYPASRTMTILLGKNNQVAYYIGENESAEMKIASVSAIHDKIEANKLLVAQRHEYNPQKHMIVIIKPTSTAKFQDFVDVLDEMKISDVKSYAIDDKTILEKEKSFMKAKGL